MRMGIPCSLQAFATAFTLSSEPMLPGFMRILSTPASTKLIKGEVGYATAVECLFVTSSRQDVAKVASLRGEAARISHDLRKESWAQRGIDIDCKSGGHCGRCADKDICDRVRAIEHMRKKLGEDK